VPDPRSVVCEERPDLRPWSSLHERFVVRSVLPSAAVQRGIAVATSCSSCPSLHVHGLCVVTLLGLLLRGYLSWSTSSWLPTWATTWTHTAVHRDVYMYVDYFEYPKPYWTHFVSLVGLHAATSSSCGLRWWSRWLCTLCY